MTSLKAFTQHQRFPAAQARSAAPGALPRRGESHPAQAAPETRHQAGGAAAVLTDTAAAAIPPSPPQGRRRASPPRATAAAAAAPAGQERAARPSRQARAAALSAAENLTSEQRKANIEARLHDPLTCFCSRPTFYPD